MRGGARQNSGAERSCYCEHCDKCKALRYYYNHKDEIKKRKEKRDKENKKKFKLQVKYDWDRT